MDTQTLYLKIATVPPAIIKWLGSEEVIDATQKMDEKFSLPTGSYGIIARLIQKMIVLKEVAPENFSGQLALALNLDKNKALIITDEIKHSFFAPIKNDLAQYGIDISLLDEFNASVPHAIPQAPKIIEEAPIPTPIAAAKSSGPKVSWTSTAMPPPKPDETKPVPVQLIEKGWARQKPVVTPGKPQAVTEFVDLAIKTPPQVPPPPQPRGMDEFARLESRISPIPAATPTPKPPVPFMMQNNSAPKPIGNTASPRSSLSTENIMDSIKASAPIAPRPIVFEMGNATAKIGSTSGSSIPKAPEPPRMLHFEERGNSSATPDTKAPSPEAGRLVAEIKASGTNAGSAVNAGTGGITAGSAGTRSAVPMPMPMPAKPVAPKTPPMPTPAQKVVVKDFLDGR